MGQVQCSEAGDEEFKSAFVVCMYMKKALFPHSVLLFSVSEWSEWDKDATKMPKLIMRLSSSSYTCIIVYFSLKPILLLESKKKSLLIVKKIL